jgi:hypothetical protein
MIFMNMNLHGLTCIQKVEVPLEVETRTWFNNIERKDLDSK